MKASDNYNLRAAMIHVIGDILQSVGVLLAAILIFFFGDNGESWNPWHLADPICTYIFSILVMFTTFHISRDCILVLMEGTPREIDPIEFKTKLYNIAHVVAIHDLHIWSMSMGKPLVSVHIIVDAKVN
jgi:zinc transporter 2